MKQRLLFIDRDGTIIKEPPTDFQVDSIEKMQFVEGAVKALSDLYQSGKYQFVMVTNQDGLGTDSFPEETFWPAHNLMMEKMTQAGIHFKEVLIDRTFPHENAPTRKPQTGLLTHYMNQDYDLKHSVVIGDRVTDLQLAQNLGAKAILIYNPVHASVEQDIERSDCKDKLIEFCFEWERIKQILLSINSVKE